MNSKIFAVLSLLIMVILLSAGFILRNSTADKFGMILLGFNIGVFFNTKFGIKSVSRENALHK